MAFLDNPRQYRRKECPNCHQLYARLDLHKCYIDRKRPWRQSAWDAAVHRLIAMHGPDFETLYNEERAKVHLPPLRRPNLYVDSPD
jgi:hypothetical protein